VPRAAVAAAVAAALALGACAPRVNGARHDALPRPRIVLLPVENLSAVNAPLRDVQTAIEVALRRHFDVVSGDILEQFMSRHRLRFTGGVDPEIAVAAREELGADAILVTSLLTWRPSSPPVVGLALRLVSATERPSILWIDQHSFSGDEAPGLLQLGVVSDVKIALVRVVDRLVRSLDLAVAGKVPEPQCGTGARYRPRVRFRPEVVPGGAGYVLAVLPFLNRTNRRSAGEAVGLEFLRQLVDSGEYEVLEPGVVRQYMLRARVIMPGGVSLETTRLFLGALEADLVLAGTVLDYAETVGPTGPTVRFTATMLEGRSGQVVWHSSSFNKGDEGVYFFGLGRVATPGKLMCRMVKPVVEELVRASAGRSSLAGVGAGGRDDKPDLRRLFQ
jgi:hypothetical protein